MDASEQLKEELRTGRIDAQRVVDLISTLQRALQAAQQRIAELEQQLAATVGPTKVEEPFSLRAEEQRQQARGLKKRRRQKKGRRGRGRTADKLARAERTEAVYPQGIPASDCWLSHTRPLWPLEQGRALFVAYHVH